MKPMDSLPAFDENGNLPDGVHSCTMSALYDGLVAAFPSSVTRDVIYRGFAQLRLDCEAQNVHGTMWVDGSFVSSEVNPKDVDVVTFVDYDELDGLLPAAQQFIAASLGAGEDTKDVYKAHTFLVPSCAQGHPFFRVFEKRRQYWRKWFGRTRAIARPSGPYLPGYPKGIIEMTIGEPQRAPIISSERS